MTLFYPDVANVNWSSDDDVVNFLSQLASEGFAGVIHKVSQGATFRDDFWMTALQWCIANSLPIIGYHYVTCADAAEQAANWVACHGTPNAMLDFEDSSGGIDNFWSVVRAFNAVGTQVRLAYIPQWYLDSDAGGYGDLSGLNAAGIRLVSSAYPGGDGFAADIYAAAGGDSGEGWTPYNGCTPAAWQFTDRASVAGFTVDCNAYKGGDINELFLGG